MTLKLPAGGTPSSQPMLVRESPPARPKSAPKESQQPASRTYTVRSGDSLSKIAAMQLGNADRHGEIQALNPGVRADKLSIGQVLRLPAGSAPAQKSTTKARSESSSPTVAKAVNTPKKSKVQ
jgi:LysM repeat protein